VTGRRGRIVGSLTARLALAFLGVALGALALFAGLVLYQGSKDVQHLSREQQDTTVGAALDASAAAFAEHRNWTSADLGTVLALAAEGGGTAEIFDTSSRLVAGAPSAPGARVVAHPIVVDGTRVGTLRMGFTPGAKPAAVQHLRDALLATVAAGAGLAALLAVVVAITVARRITRPLGALTAAARAVERGDLDARVAPVTAPGELGELVETFDRMADALAREDRVRRALVADVAHEVRTPLTTLRAGLEGLVDGAAEPTGAQFASLHDDVLRLGRVIEDLETLAAAESAPLHMEFVDVDLAAAAADTTSSLAPQFEAAGIQVDVRAAPANVRADPHRVRQVIMNLLTNSLKFTPAGGTVTVTVEAHPPDARLVVSDTGVGIPAGEQAHVFDRFWRGAAARTVEGRGIGLTIAAELVRAHGGTIAVASTPGSDTRMTVTLPLA